MFKIIGYGIKLFVWLVIFLKYPFAYAEKLYSPFISRGAGGRDDMMLDVFTNFKRAESASELFRPRLLMAFYGLSPLEGK